MTTNTITTSSINLDTTIPSNTLYSALYQGGY